MDKLVISVNELAQTLGISTPKAYELTKQIGFPAVRVGGRILIPVDKLKIWLENHCNNKN